MMPGGVEREVSKPMCVRIVRRGSWEREAECPVEAVLNYVRIRRG